MRNKPVIHPTAVVSKGAVLGKGVVVGPFTVIGENVKIDDGTVIGPSCMIDGWTKIGKNCQITYGAAIGTPPQDLKYRGQKNFVEIGDCNIIREFVSIHRSALAGGKTVIGNNNMLMGYVHVAHDCIIGNEVVVANYTGFSGHVEIEDRAIIGGMTGIHQFVRIGSLAMIGGYSKVVKDIPPFAMADGQPAKLFGLNIRGLIRRSVSSDSRKNLKKAYGYIISPKHNLTQAINQIKKNVKNTAEVKHLIKFLEAPSKMGVLIRR